MALHFTTADLFIAAIGGFIWPWNTDINKNFNKNTPFFICDMRGSRKFCQRGSKFDFFKLILGREDTNTTLSY